MPSREHPQRTEDGRHLVIRGRRWRASDPALPEPLADALRSELGRARSVLRTARDPSEVALWRDRVQLAKEGLGERGTPWWQMMETDRRRRARERLLALRGVEAPCTERPDADRKAPMPRSLAPGQRSRIRILDVETGQDVIVHDSAEVLYEAPNWSYDGDWLIVNGDGHLFRVPVGGGDPQQIDLGDLPDLNNDHVLAPDGQDVYVSADDGRIHRAPLSGGETIPVTEDDGHLHFLHGVSPDGTTLAYIGVQRLEDGTWLPPKVFTVPSSGGAPTPLTQDEFPDDGAEYSPDGAWIYFNSERARTAPGHAQLFRMRPDGSGVEQLTYDERVNWFPHLSPDGRRMAYVSFPPGTLGHPADRDVILRLCTPEGTDIRDLVRLHGGQGTMNVNSWAPDSRRLAYVDYPVDA